MTSVKRQLPYDYYSLPFCKPGGGKLRYKPENLGEILRGDRIVNTPYEVGHDTLTSCQHKSNNILEGVGEATNWL